MHFVYKIYPHGNLTSKNCKTRFFVSKIVWRIKKCYIMLFTKENF